MMLTIISRIKKLPHLHGLIKPIIIARKMEVMGIDTISILNLSKYPYFSLYEII